jgi:hypothetical protein
MRYAPKKGVGPVKVASAAAYRKNGVMKPSLFSHNVVVMGHPVLTLKGCRGKDVHSRSLYLESSWAVR